MNLTSAFPQPFYTVADDAVRADVLNKMAAIVPVQETDTVSPSAVRSSANVAVALGGDEAFLTLAQDVLDTTYLDGNQNACVRIGIQNKLFAAFEAYNKGLEPGGAVALTDSGRAHFATCKRARDVYAGMAHGGIGATTYQIGTPR